VLAFCWQRECEGASRGGFFNKEGFGTDEVDVYLRNLLRGSDCGWSGGGGGG